MTKKKILLLMTSDFRICDAFKENLEFLNYEVLLISDKHKFKYKNIIDRAINFYKKIFLKDKSYKRELARKYDSEKIMIILNNQKHFFDFALTIRPDKFSESILKKIKEISKFSIAYQWDGLSRFPEVTNTINLFDKFYVFDKNDLALFPNKLHYSTNFYFDSFDFISNSKPEFDIFFVGSYDSRIDDLIIICEKLIKLKLKLNILIATSPKEHLKKYSYINFLNKPLTYIQNIELLAKSKIVIDLGHKNLHTGLSFRTFEAIGYEKKLITTNKIVKNFDFYNPQNIFVLDNNLNDLENFINKPFEKLNDKIKGKYSFSNWIRYMTNQNPFDKLE